ncbi:cytochrome P450 [Penicillium hispanicum]|uniref:cytochrome P450 n=1 Tax=Penicillium hispanicum TaxID=1080232 RepID=UPI00254054D6|nr:cytochrome P450 [Penicillium hispanicum]KAJ5578493.1 cytochrome P450 [Penicillium hispanicum]
MLQSIFQSWSNTVGRILPPVLQSPIYLIAIALAVFVLTTWALRMLAKSPIKPAGSPPQLLMPMGEILRHFSECQFDFIREGFRATSSSIFQFKLNRHDVITLSGDEGRNRFYAEKGLDLYEGYQIFISTVRGFGWAVASYDFNKLTYSGSNRIGPASSPRHVQALIPSLLSDCERTTAFWGDQGELDPCSAVHDVTFQMIIRATTSFDVADNPALVTRLQHNYDVIDSPFKPFLTKLPWLPGPSVLWKIWALGDIYRVFKKTIRDRENSGIFREDALQQMLDAGESEGSVLQLMIGLPIAGARSTGTIGTWLIIFLSSQPEWAAAVREEIQTLINTHNFTSSPRSKQVLIQALSSIPLSAWESQLPRLDFCIRETLRTSQPLTAVRKNMGPDFSIGPYTIPRGSFIAYPVADTSLTPAYYPDPTRWDPARGVNKDAPFLGWGGGRHACQGQRLATLTMKLVAAYTLMRFDLAMVDEQGKRMQSPPSPDWNDVSTCHPREKCRIACVERLVNNTV